MSDQPLLGIPISPYSIKVRAYLRYKAIPFEWIDRDRRHEKLFQRHARVQLIPPVLFPNGEAMRDSTPIIERLEEEYPESSIHPEAPPLPSFTRGYGPGFLASGLRRESRSDVGRCRPSGFQACRVNSSGCVRYSQPCRGGLCAT